jgi:capsule polysaccharide export protein KpsE/RkpR
VTRKSIYRRDDPVALIRAHRPVTAVPDDPPPPADRETSIVAALQARLTAKDTQIADLKAALRERDRTIAALHGELDKLHAAGS